MRQSSREFASLKGDYARSLLCRFFSWVLVFSLQGTALADPLPKSKDSPALSGKIRHRAVALLPLPRDRTVFGIGEDVEFWIDPPDAEGPHAVIAWHVQGEGTVCPVIGPHTIATVALSSKPGGFKVVALRRDLALPPQVDKDKVNLRDWIREQLAALPKGEREPVGKGPPVPPEYAKELREDLIRLDDMRRGTKTPFAEVDELGVKLLVKYRAPKERGQIYYQLAHVHAQSGLVHPERAIEYAKKALEHPLDHLQIPRLHVYWGDALQVAKAKEPLASRRKWSAVVYLAGLNEVLRHPLPAKAPELPGVGRISGDGFLQQLHNEQVEARARGISGCHGPASRRLDWPGRRALQSATGGLRGASGTCSGRGAQFVGGGPVSALGKEWALGRVSILIKL